MYAPSCYQAALGCLSARRKGAKTKLGKSSFGDYSSSPSSTKYIPTQSGLARHRNAFLLCLFQRSQTLTSRVALCLPLTRQHTVEKCSAKCARLCLLAFLTSRTLTGGKDDITAALRICALPLRRVVVSVHDWRNVFQRTALSHWLVITG